MNNEELLTMQQLNKSHKNDLLSLATIVGWDYDLEEIQTLLYSGTIFGHITLEKKVISCAAIIPYGSKLASIGMVIVHPNYRGRGLAKTLLLQCMNQVPKNMALMLIATKEGRPVYEKLAFKEYSHVTKLLGEGKRMKLELDDYTIHPLEQTDLEEMFIFDQAAFGSSRVLFLENRIKQAKDSLVLKNRKGVMVGYALTVKKTSNLVIGPIVAQDEEQAILLIKTIIANNQGSIRIDIVEGKNTIIEELQKLGFQIVNRPPVMVKNIETFPKRNNCLYAIAAQAYG
ncbi:GNAT family N-acetyltransferase [Niallia sp. MER TA 168]|uniref:GNAT family N-acetyltransferase n=1 Tax=Niallia sp. MER TA 168 TaxID=2939568 RepID=UPI002042054C|nr:GNAT family N-acetyltransferase [Niallia sp. MER TA 168]MCM3364430.1 GNAT family N-acetyltransferase [Niallia sp. MER TA 168]